MTVVYGLLTHVPLPTLKGKLDEAEALLLRALEICETTFGRDHPKFADTLDNLVGVASSFIDQGVDLGTQVRCMMNIPSVVLGGNLYSEY